MDELRENLIKGLKTISLLSSEGGRTMKQLEQAIGVGNSTVYRYKNALASVGFDIGQEGHRYFIRKTPKNLQVHLNFTAEEVDLIRVALQSSGVSSTNFEVISDKLYIHSDLLTIPNKILEAQFGINIAYVQKAIIDRKQILLKGYRSAHSNTIRDRLVEPIDLQDNYRRLYVYDVEKQKIYQYKMERIDEVVLTDTPFRYAHRHTKIATDVFWIEGNPKTMIQLRLSLSAYEILKEEYPRVAEVSQRTSDTEYLLQTEVVDFMVVSSFILRLPGEVEVLSPSALVDYLRERIKKYKF